jgi:fused signal recognition particle receptor
MIFWKKNSDSVPAGDVVDRPGETWVSRLGMGLGKSTAKLTQGLADLVTKRKLDQTMLDQLEETLLLADLGPKTAIRIVEDFSKDRFGKDLSDEDIRAALADIISDVLKPVAKPIEMNAAAKPYVILVCGVNGAGKTTTIGKLAAHWTKDDGKKVMIAAGDTFRAAAVEQLKVWADRAGVAFFSKETGADSAAVAYEAFGKAKSEGTDVLMIDTAGRLQNKSNLMAELQKIVRVLKKHDPAIPHATLLVLDATTGQNAYSQVEHFSEMVPLSGLIVTKLDGSAKGGVVVGLADQFRLPIHAVGVGEHIDDLRPFDPDAFARLLVGLSPTGTG